MNKYQTLAANTILMSAGTFGSKLLVFLMVRFYTGYLTPAEYGTADLITQTANLLIPLVSLDITDAVFRFAADRQGKRAEAFSVGLRVITLGSAGTLAVIALPQGVPAVRAYGFLLASFVIASCYHGLCAHFVRAQGNTALFAVQGLFNTALFIGLNVLSWRSFTGASGATCSPPRRRTSSRRFCLSGRPGCGGTSVPGPCGAFGGRCRATVSP